MTAYILFPEGHSFYEASEPGIYEDNEGWVLRYRDHHTVKQDRRFGDRAAAYRAAFLWRLERGVFTEEKFGGCASEVGEYWGLRVYRSLAAPFFRMPIDAIAI